ncbi:phytase [Streptomyces chilikensis]|uniref:Phytase n=1 Tax=Streptomyces chilikensis TaxID=1194079 RepID=A0ABV3EL29_9ACTN
MKTRNSRPRVLSAAALGAAVAVAATTLAAAPPAGASDRFHDGLPGVTPRAETAPVFDDEEGGNADADDPAIWRNAADPDRSLVITAVKEGGLRVYDLDARQVQAVAAPPAPGPEDAPGRFNNVDLVHGLRLSSGRADVAVSSDRGTDRLRFHRIDGGAAGAPPTDVTDAAAPRIFTASQEEVNEERTAYGLAAYTDRRTGRSYAVVSRAGTTEVALLELDATSAGTVTYRKVRTVALPAAFRLPGGGSWSPCGEPGELPQVEGMVVDTRTGTLYAGQEDVGVWRLPADLRGAPRLLDKVREFGVPAAYDEESDECLPAGEDPGLGGARLAADVEGLTLLPGGAGGAGRLIVSSQGDDTFAVYERGRYADGFRVVASGELDGAEECDGAAVLDAPLGSRYPDGLLVVQDGHVSPEDDDREATGFKFVDLAHVEAALGERRS